MACGLSRNLASVSLTDGLLFSIQEVCKSGWVSKITAGRDWTLCQK